MNPLGFSPILRVRFQTVCDLGHSHITNEWELIKVGAERWSGVQSVLGFFDDDLEGEANGAGGADKLALTATVAVGGKDHSDRFPDGNQSAAPAYANA